jgi:hypothetical protein
MIRGGAAFSSMNIVGQYQGLKNLSSVSLVQRLGSDEQLNKCILVHSTIHG